MSAALSRLEQTSAELRGLLSETSTDVTGQLETRTQHVLGRLDQVLGTANSRLSETAMLFESMIGQTTNGLEDRITSSSEALNALMSNSVDSARGRLEETASLFQTLVEQVTAGVENLLNAYNYGSGREYFVGAGIFFSDQDLRALLVGGGALALTGQFAFLVLQFLVAARIGSGQLLRHFLLALLLLQCQCLDILLHGLDVGDRALQTVELTRQVLHRLRLFLEHAVECGQLLQQGQKALTVAHPSRKTELPGLQAALHQLAPLDYTGVTASRSPLLWSVYGAITLGMFVIAWSGRQRQMLR